MNDSLQFTSENLKEFDVKNICNALQGDHIRSLSLRECELSDKDFKKISKGIGKNKSILQLGLNVGVVSNTTRVDALVEALKKNRSLTALFISGNSFGDDGMKVIGEALTQHPNIISLDISDCNLSDDCIETICDLLPCNGAKSGLLDLTISFNPNISTKGWAKFGIALAASNTLRELYVDYNSLGDYAASCILIGLTSHRKIEVLDFESTGVTDDTAQLILYLVENFPVRLRKLVLDENKIGGDLLQTIKDSIDTIEDSELYSESGDDTSLMQTKSDQKPVGVRVKSVKVQPSKSSLNNGVQNSNESELKDTTTTDEEYRVLAEALEAGLQTTENDTVPTTLQEEDTEMNNTLTEIVTDTAKSDNSDMVQEKVELDILENGDNSDEGEELLEVPVIPQETILNIGNTEEYRKLMEKQLEEEEDIANSTINKHTIKHQDDNDEEEWGEELKEVPIKYKKTKTNRTRKIYQ